MDKENPQPFLHQRPGINRYIMTKLKLIIAFLLITVSSCSQNTAKRKVDPKASILTNKIMPLVSYIDNPDSCRQALLYLDSATKIDNNCFLCYHNKLMFLYPLKQFNKAVEAVNQCLRIKPSAYDLYLTGGILYEKMGDTITSKKYFHQSLTILNLVLDTMKVKDMTYDMLMSNKGINLIMLDDYKASKDLFKALLDKEQEPDLKEMTLSYMNKTKKELVDMMTSSQYSH